MNEANTTPSPHDANTGELRFDGRTAIVTGGGRGVGREYCRLLAARGAHIVINDISQDPDSGTASAEILAAEIQAQGGTAVACTASVASEDGAHSMVEMALEIFGRIDIVVNNAGILDPKPFVDSTIDDFERMIAVHYYGAAMLCRAAWPHMVSEGYGRIINTISTSILGEPTHATYGGSKAAVLGLTLNLAVEGRPLGIVTNAFTPSAVTNIGDSASQSRPPSPTLELGRRLLLPRRVAPAVVYLAHETCTLNGQFIFSGGGRTARFFLAQTHGYVNPDGTPEDIAANIEQVMHEPGYQVYPQMMDEVRHNLARLSAYEEDVAHGHATTSEQP